MKEISIFTYLARINKEIPRKYDFEKEICYFPDTNEYISLTLLSDELSKKGIFVNYKESYAQRKQIRNEDEEWRAFILDLKRKCDFKCELSNIGLSESKLLSNKIFGLDLNCSWVNSWLTPHHIDGKCEYKCFNKDKLMILNRAIHMAYHRRLYLDAFIKREKPDYQIYFEIGSLVHDTNGVYPWRNINKEGRNYGTTSNCYQW